MRKIFNEFFYVPKIGKINEKLMFTRIVRTITVVVICLAAMSITAYAYFSCDVTSDSNIIKAANFNAEISITDEHFNLVMPSSTNSKKTTFTFAIPGVYTVKLAKGDSTAGTGFCIVYIGEEKYHTQQIGVDVTADNTQREFVEFILKVNTPNTMVTIESHWGTSSYYNFNSTVENAFYIVNEPKREIVIGTPVGQINESDDSVDSSQIEQTPTGVTHIVVQDENLTKIAEIYGTTPERIAAYNKLTNPSNIQIGQELNIPPVEWETPENNKQVSSTVSSETISTTQTTTSEISENSATTDTIDSAITSKTPTTAE